MTAAEIAGRQVKVLLCETQEPGSAARALLSADATAGIQVVILSQDVEPAGTTYQQWLSGQLQTLEQALS